MHPQSSACTNSSVPAAPWHHLAQGARAHQQTPSLWARLGMAPQPSASGGKSYLIVLWNEHWFCRNLKILNSWDHLTLGKVVTSAPAAQVCQAGSVLRTGTDMEGNKPTTETEGFGSWTLLLPNSRHRH